MAPEGGAEWPADERPAQAGGQQAGGQQQGSGRPLILITEPQNSRHAPQLAQEVAAGEQRPAGHTQREGQVGQAPLLAGRIEQQNNGLENIEREERLQEEAEAEAEAEEGEEEEEKEEDQFEVVDGISYRIVAAVTTKRRPARAKPPRNEPAGRQSRKQSSSKQQQQQQPEVQSRLSAMRRKSSAFVANLSSFLVPNSRSSHELGENSKGGAGGDELTRPRRMSIYEMTKSPPPETSIEMYLNERRRSSTVSAKFVQQQLEQQSTFETNYCARQQYFKDLNEKLINQDKRLLNVVANRGQMHRHSVDIAQLPLELAQANAAAARKFAAAAAAVAAGAEAEPLDELLEEEDNELQEPSNERRGIRMGQQQQQQQQAGATINQVQGVGEKSGLRGAAMAPAASSKQLASICEHRATQFVESEGADGATIEPEVGADQVLGERKRALAGVRAPRAQVIKKKFAQFEARSLSSAPAPDVKIGQRVAYKEYYGNEFGTIRWIGRVPQISADWTVGVEFDNAIGEGDGSLHGRRYFIAKDCFAKFLPLVNVALVDQHVGRPEPGTMISVMSAAVRPGQMISIQRVSTVHVQHCFLNAPHRRPGAEFLAVNTRLHCQCPNCGPCAHVVKPPRTQRLRTPKNATHMCQFSTYTCCGMESSEEALCTYTGNKISSVPPPGARHNSLAALGLPPAGASWIQGAGYLSHLQAEQRKLMPQEYRLGAAPTDVVLPGGGGGVALLPHQHAGAAHSKTRARHRHAYHDAPGTPPPSADSAQQHANEAGKQQQQQQRRHHKHHKHHKHRRKQPLQQLDKWASRTESPRPHTPLYANVAPAEGVQPPSALETRDELALSALGDKTVHLEHGEGATNRQPAQQWQPTWATAKLAEEEPLKPARIVYRDSIENRYLFPTDDADAIDSTLEHDLDELSQARYGYLRGPARQQHWRRSPSGHARASSCSASGRHSPNLLLKSLRSLVSCLSANKTGSDFESNYQSASNLGQQAMRLVDERTLTNSAGEFINKSAPMLMANGHSMTHSTNDWRPAGSSSASSSSCSSSCSTTPTRLLTGQHHAHQQRFYEQLSQQQQQQHEQGQFMRTVTHQHEHTTQLVELRQLAGQPVRRQISSSSDCGFSSASQNSTANFGAAAAAATSSPTPLPPSAAASRLELDERQRRRLSALFKRLAARLISSSSSRSNSSSGSSSGASSPVSAQDLLKLRASLFELRAQSAHLAGGSQLDCCEHLLAELIKKSALGARSPTSNSKSASPRHRQRASSTSANEPTKASPTHQRAANETPASSELPRAFELKLTLSINDNAKCAQQQQQQQQQGHDAARATDKAGSVQANSMTADETPRGQQPNVSFSLVAPAVPVEQSTAAS